MTDINNPLAVMAGTNTTNMNTVRNKVQLLGTLGNHPEIKTLETGKKIARFSIATHQVYRNIKGEKVTDTQWHNIIVWGKLAEIAERHLTKGKEVLVEGKIVYRTYNDKEGQKKYVTEIQVDEMLLLGRASEL